MNGTADMADGLAVGSLIGNVRPTCGRRWGGAATIAIVLAIGCSSRIEPVSGLVTLNGKPQGGLKLMFEPKSSKGKRAMALTSPDGRFSLYRQGMGSRAGAIVGDYVVRVYAGDSDDPDAGPVIPDRYSRSSTLEFQVKPGQANSFEINLESP